MYSPPADDNGTPHHPPRDENTLMSLTQLGNKRLFVFATGNIVQQNELLHCVARGNKVRVIEIIECHPELLLEPGRAVTYAGKMLEGFTPLQIALLEGDVQIHDGQPEMAEVLRDALVENYGHEILQKQVEKLYKKLGVEGHAELVRQQEASAEETRGKINALVDVINNCKKELLEAALNCDQVAPAGDNALWQQLSEFRGWFTHRANVEEKAYNPYHILVAFDAYTDAFNKLGNGRMGDRHRLFWRQVVGWVQRFASASTAQVFVTSLFDIIHYGKLLQRRLSFHSDFSFFPVSSSLGGLGFNWAVTDRHPWVSGDALVSGGCVWFRTDCCDFQKLCQTKTIQQRAYSAGAANPISEQVSPAAQNELPDGDVMTGFSQLL